MKKEKASAMVMAVLILAFFMTLSLNMYFLAGNKAERATFRSEGTTIMGDMDASTTLGYYELFVASEYITKGFIINFGTTHSGIRLPSYIEYFAHKLDSTTGNAIITNNITSPAIAREWSVIDGNLKELWHGGGETSIGGYKFKYFKKNKNDLITYLDITAIIPSGTSGTAFAIYNKTVIFPSDSALNLEKSEFEIEVTRNSTFSVNASIISDITSDKIEEIKVIKK